MFRALSLLCLLWGFNWVVMKVANEYFSPSFFAMLRFSTGAAILLMVTMIKRIPLPQKRSQMQGLMDSEITRRGQLLANQALVQSAGDRLRLDKERRAILAEDRVMTLKIMERDNMTEQDRAVGVKEGAGFKDF